MDQTQIDQMQAELHFLRWFVANCDFGPADSDVRAILHEEYTEATGKPVPEGWGTE